LRAVARTLIRNGIVLPMTGGTTVFDPGSVLVDGDTIVAVGPVDAIDGDPRGGRRDRGG
jgi:imidazolonepropionase-like amidohydrolase